MQSRIPEFLKTEFKKDRNHIGKFPLDIKQYMLEYSNFHKWNTTDYEIIFKSMKKGFSNLPECAYASCKNILHITDLYNNRECCSSIHTRQYNKIKPFMVSETIDYVAYLKTIKRFDDLSDDAILYLEKTYASKNIYGFEPRILFKFWKNNINDIPKCSYANCNENVTIKKDGTFSIACSLSHAQKVNCLEKNGFESYFQQSDFVEEIKKTNLEKYGSEFYSSTLDFKLKSQATFKKKYGVTNPMKHHNIQNRFKKTMIEKYGVESALQNPKILSKNQEAQYKIKEYIWKDNNISYCQGYEPIVLKELEDMGFIYVDVKTSPEDMPEIWYIFEGKRKRYYPDIFIPKENLIIEVKSEYTINTDKKRNKCKWNATKKLGYNFKVEIR